MTILCRIALPVLATVLLATAPAWAVSNYIAIPLGAPGDGTLALGINASGQVTGERLVDNGTYHAFLFSAGTMQDLGTLGGAYSSGAGLDSSGRVVGYATTIDGDYHAFLYSGGTMQDLGTLGGKFSRAFAINNDGQVVGWTYTPFGTRAFLYSGGTMRELGTLGGQNSFGIGINGSGQVTGWANTARYYGHAFLYSGGTMQDLGTLGGLESYGYGINASGEVVGAAAYANSGGLVHAFLYSGGTMRDLGTLGSPTQTPSSKAVGINSHGEVVGVSVAGFGRVHAFLYAGGTMYDLNSLVVSGLGGATLLEAKAINDRGQIVANTCDHVMTGCTAFRLDPISGPATVLPVVEYYHAGFDHYFITWMPNEITILDAGTQIKGWVRTGYSFKTYTTVQAGTSPVCRYYIPPGLGDSHFFGRGMVECNATGQKNPTFVLEDPAFMQTFLPTAGVCPASTTPVYRVFSNRLDANHRYMTDRTVRDQMVAKGWLAEGDGPDLVVMCAPQG